MIPRYLYTSTPVRIAAAAALVGIGMVARTAVSAIRVELAPVATIGQEPLAASTAVQPDTTSDDLVSRAIDRNPFGVRRIAAASPKASSPQAVAAVSAPIRLVGTVVDGASGDFALCQVGTEPPKIVRLGQTVGNYVLRRITQGAASFDSPTGQRMELRVSKPGS